ncbi:helicase [Cenarchaeum symbiosum A]|uniref:Helicase n=1 Tax=Cenarchaeum symbiosum (strain A) TaxID=414004 RepID=A0RWC5_CENSY|nr:helicase [Cenarchaeum symbiosum A]
MKKSIEGVGDWKVIEPDGKENWINLPINNPYVPMGSKEAKKGANAHTIFSKYSLGIATHRDAWVYNSSDKELAKNIKVHIKYCNEEGPTKPDKPNPKRGSWSSDLDGKLERLSKQGKKMIFDAKKIRTSLYRPFFKQQLYFDDILVTARYKIDDFYSNNDTVNPAIIVPYHVSKPFSTFITCITPDLQIIQNGQCFPLYTYNDGVKKNNITDSIVKEYREHYRNNNISKDDIFYYVYAILHHPRYRNYFRNNLIRDLPGIPMAPEFERFQRAGRELANIHLNFDTGKRYSLGKPAFHPKGFIKITFGGKNEADKSIIRVDGHELFNGVPISSYTVNGRTPVEWIAERFEKNKKIPKDKSGNFNDPCTGTDIVAVIERAVYVGLESDRIIKTLPKEFEPKNWKPKADPASLDAYSENGQKTRARPAKETRKSRSKSYDVHDSMVKRAQDLLVGNHVRKKFDKYQVVDKEKKYIIDEDDLRCACPVYKKFNECSHVWAVELCRRK